MIKCDWIVKSVADTDQKDKPNVKKSGNFLKKGFGRGTGELEARPFCLAFGCFEVQAISLPVFWRMLGKDI